MISNGHSLNGRGAYIWMDVSPAVAQSWLDKNDVNRRVRPATVKQYATDMVAGNWRGADSPLTVTESGNLEDGQHRLNAIIAANMTIGMWIHIIGDDVNPMDLRMDLGKPRSITDLTGTPKREAACARMLIVMSDPRRAWGVASVDRVLEVVERIKPELDQLSKTASHGLGATAQTAATCFSMHAYPSDAETIAAQFNAMVNRHFDYPFWPAVSSALRQSQDTVTGGFHARRLNFLRFVRAFSAKSRGASKVQFRDIAGAHEEIAPRIAEYIATNS